MGFKVYTLYKCDWEAQVCFFYRYLRVQRSAVYPLRDVDEEALIYRICMSVQMISVGTLSLLQLGNFFFVHDSVQQNGLQCFTAALNHFHYAIRFQKSSAKSS